MNKPILCFGEVLWDLLPQGKILGGAPFNVAFRLHELGEPTLFCSGIGNDILGADIQKQLENFGVPFQLKINEKLVTGVVNVSLALDGSASYQIEDPAAWDEIDVPQAWNGDLVFGSLALRHKSNEQALLALAQKANKVYFDVNLRAPYFSFEKIENWIKFVHLVKFNEEEFEWFLFNKKWKPSSAIQQFFEEYTSTMLCITKGESGAIFAINQHQVFEATAPKIELADTIGAGDAFFASLIHGMRRGSHPQDCLEKACRIGAFVASQNGATTPIGKDLNRI